MSLAYSSLGVVALIGLSVLLIMGGFCCYRRRQRRAIGHGTAASTDGVPPLEAQMSVREVDTKRTRQEVLFVSQPDEGSMTFTHVAVRVLDSVDLPAGPSASDMPWLQPGGHLDTHSDTSQHVTITMDDGSPAPAAGDSRNPSTADTSGATVTLATGVAAGAAAEPPVGARSRVHGSSADGLATVDGDGISEPSAAPTHNSSGVAVSPPMEGDDATSQAPVGAAGDSARPPIAAATTTTIGGGSADATPVAGDDTSKSSSATSSTRDTPAQSSTAPLQRR